MLLSYQNCRVIRLVQSFLSDFLAPFEINQLKSSQEASLLFRVYTRITGCQPAVRTVSSTKMRKTFYSFVSIVCLLALFVGTACMTASAQGAVSMTGHSQDPCSHCSKHAPAKQDTNSCCVAHHQPGSTTAWTEVEQPSAASPAGAHHPLLLAVAMAPSLSHFVEPPPSPPRVPLRI